MIDIFSEEYQLERVKQIAFESQERFEKMTHEEKIRELQEMGWLDENGNLKPEYEWLHYIKRNH